MRNSCNMISCGCSWRDQPQIDILLCGPGLPHGFLVKLTRKNSAWTPCCYSCALLRSEKTSVYENTRVLHVFPVQTCCSETNSGNLPSDMCSHMPSRCEHYQDNKLCYVMWRTKMKILLNKADLFLLSPSFLWGGTDRRTHTHLGSFGSSNWHPVASPARCRCIIYTQCVVGAWISAKNNNVILNAWHGAHDSNWRSTITRWRVTFNSDVDVLNNVTAKNMKPSCKKGVICAYKWVVAWNGVI